MRWFNELLLLKGFGDLKSYLDGDVGTSEIYGKSMHDFPAFNDTKKVSENIENIFDIILDNYGSTIEGGCNP